MTGRLKYAFGVLTVLTVLAGVAYYYYGSMREDSEVGKDIYLAVTSFDPRLVTHVDTGGKKLVALTFDDGPDPRFTPRILSILDRYHVKATFFVVGMSAYRYPDLLKAEAAAGHEVENHTYSHPDLRIDNQYKVNEEILCGQKVVEDLLRENPVYFRPPKGLFSKGVIDLAKMNGLETVLWTVCVENSCSPTPEKMAKRAIEHAEPGAIILAHDGRLDRSKTVQALPLIIEGYQRMGYRFVTLEDLFKNRVKSRRFD